MVWHHYLTFALQLPWTLELESVGGDRPHTIIRIRELPGFIVGVEPHENLYTQLGDALSAYLAGCAAVGREPALPSFIVRPRPEREVTGSTALCLQ